MHNGQNIATGSEMSSLVANQINAMLAYWDAQLICRFANNAYLEWFGRTKEEMVDKMSIQELLGPQLYAKNLPYIQEALKATNRFLKEQYPPRMVNRFDIRLPLIFLTWSMEQLMAFLCM